MPTLRPYQMDLVEMTRQARAKGARIIVVTLPTGAGKTSVLSYIVQQAFNKNAGVLCMAHRRRLIDQISDRLVEFDVPHAMLMADKPLNTSKLVQVASRDTLLSRCIRNEWMGMPSAKLIIIDEGHHVAPVDSEYRRILQQYPEATVLLFTATPVGPDGKGMGPFAQALVCSASTSQLVKDGFLCPVKCFAPDRKTKGKKVARGIAGDLVESWKQYGENRPTVLFCSRVKHSRDAVRAYLEAGIAAVHVDADTPDYERDQAFDDVASGRIKILSNVGIITEGVDVPELGCCQLYCEVNGRVKFMQATGRIMRPMPNKKYGIVIDHSACVFRHGFPDEDMEWSLEGNTDELFQEKQKKGETEKALYCSRCELVYKGSECCPQCGREPVKPPRSIFAPPEVEARNELLVEADRNSEIGVYSQEEKIRHWFLCLRTAVKRNGTFKMASVIFKQKYQQWPEKDYPMMVGWSDMNRKVSEVYPDFGRGRAS